MFTHYPELLAAFTVTELQISLNKPNILKYFMATCHMYDKSAFAFFFILDMCAVFPSELLQYHEK